MPRALGFIVFVVAALAVMAPAAAQLNDLNVKGKVIEVGPLALWVQTETGDKWLADINPKRVEDGVEYRGLPEPAVEVHGNEGPDFLRAGMFVRFEADVERKRVIKGAVESLTVIGPGKDNVYGLLPGGGPPGDAKDPDTERMLVVGQLSAATRGNITVAFPDGKNIKAKLAPEAVVKIASNDYQLARVGDEVEVKGYYGRAPHVFVTSLKVQRAAKAEKPNRRPTTPAKKPEPAKNPGEAAALPEFGEGDPRDAKEEEAPAVPKKLVPGRILKIN